MCRCADVQMLLLMVQFVLTPIRMTVWLGEFVMYNYGNQQVPEYAATQNSKLAN